MKLNPVTLAKNPVMFVVEVGRGADDGLRGARHRGRRGRPRVWHPDRAVALVHGAVREFRRSHGGSARQGASRQPAQDQDGCPRPADRLVRQDRASARFRPARRRRRVLRRGRLDPWRRRSDRRHRDRGRIRDHRRKRARDSRIGRRSQRRDRRHARAVGSDQDPDHFQPRRNVSGPHDRAGGRRGAAEDAQRNRAEHSDRRLDADLPAGRRHAAALRRVQRERRRALVPCRASRFWFRCWSA